MIHIGAEAPAEAGAREALLDRVMGEKRFDKPSQLLRDGRLPAAGLSFVARDAGEVVGTVRLWHVDAGGRPALLLGPLAVDRDRHGEGIGGRLMRYAVDRARRAGHGAILLVGDPEYYARFGFTGPAARLAMPKPVERRRLLARELIPGHLAGAAGPVIATGRSVRPRPSIAAELRLAA